MHSALDPAENGVLAVQPGRWSERDEELRPIGIGARIGHAEDASTRVLQRWGDFVLEFLAVHGLAATPGACGIAALNHEVGYYAVKDDVIEVIALRER